MAIRRAFASLFTKKKQIRNEGNSYGVRVLMSNEVFYASGRLKNTKNLYFLDVKVN